MSERKNKTLTYKVARFLKGKHNLQALLHAALKKKDKAADRRQPLDGEEQSFRLINSHSTQGPVVCGEMFTYTKGTHQVVLELDENAKEFSVEQLAPPNKKSEFVESMFYFGVMDNHVIVAQSMAFRTDKFEQYLNWFLKDWTGVVEADEWVAISDLPPTKLRQHDFREVHGISIGAPLEYSMAPGNRPGQHAVTPTNKIWQAFVSSQHSWGPQFQTIYVSTGKATLLSASICNGKAVKRNRQGLSLMRSQTRCATRMAATMKFNFRAGSKFVAMN